MTALRAPSHWRGTRPAAPGAVNDNVARSIPWRAAHFALSLLAVGGFVAAVITLVGWP